VRKKTERSEEEKIVEKKEEVSVENIRSEVIKKEKS